MPLEIDESAKIHTLINTFEVQPNRRSMSLPRCAALPNGTPA